jgi:hypothetical protein
MILDVWDSLLNDDTPRPISLMIADDQKTSDSGNDHVDLDDISLIGQLFSIGWLLLFSQLCLGSVALVLVLHFQRIALTSGVERRTVVTAVVGIVWTVVLWGGVSMGVSFLGRAVFLAVKSEIGIA